MSYHRQDMYYENANQSHRLPPQGSLLYTPSPIDSAANSQTGFSGSDDPNSRFDAQRFNDRMNPATMHGNFGHYDMPPQPWNGNAYAGSMNRMKPPSRGRQAIPTVSPAPMPVFVFC